MSTKVLTNDVTFCRLPLMLPESVTHGKFYPSIILDVNHVIVYLETFPMQEHRWNSTIGSVRGIHGSLNMYCVKLYF